MYDPEPELITIIEGPTPEFRPSPYLWFDSVYEGPEDAEVVICELRTLNGESIVERCRDAWDEGRPVKLEFPDYMRMPQRADVVAMRLQQVEEGPLLTLWVRQPISLPDEEEFDGTDDGLNF